MEIDIVVLGEVIGLAGYMILEFWFGKTDKTSAGSLLEFVIKAGAKMLPLLKKKK